MREYKVCASSMIATYNAGRWVASSPAEACRMARDNYRDSDLGRCLKDVGAFRFYVVTEFDYERAERLDRED